MLPASVLVADSECDLFIFFLHSFCQMQGMPGQESSSCELIGANKTLYLTEEDIPERRNFHILNGMLQGMQY